MPSSTVTRSLSSPSRTLPALVTGRVVAAALGVNYRTVQRWTAAGRLTAVRIAPRTTRYRVRDIEALIDPDPQDATSPQATGSAQTTDAGGRGVPA